MGRGIKGTPKKFNNNNEDLLLFRKVVRYRYLFTFFSYLHRTVVFQSL